MTQWDKKGAFSEGILRKFLFWGQIYAWRRTSRSILERAYKPDKGYVKGLTNLCSRLSRWPELYQKHNGEWKMHRQKHNFFSSWKQKSFNDFNFEKVRERAHRIKDNGGKFTL